MVDKCLNPRWIVAICGEHRMVLGQCQLTMTFHVCKCFKNGYILTVNGEWQRLIAVMFCHCLWWSMMTNLDSWWQSTKWWKVPCPNHASPHRMVYESRFGIALLTHWDHPPRGSMRFAAWSSETQPDLDLVHWKRLVLCIYDGKLKSNYSEKIHHCSWITFHSIHQ